LEFSRELKNSIDNNCLLFTDLFREDDMLDMAPLLQENSRLGIKKYPVMNFNKETVCHVSP